MSFGSCFHNPLGSKIRGGTLNGHEASALHSSSRLQTLIYKWNAKCTFICKDDFGPLSNSPVIFLLSPGKMLLTMFLFQKSPASVHSLWSSPKCLNRLCLTVSSLLLVHLFLPIFFFPVNFAFIMLWYSVDSVNSHTLQEWPSVTFPLCGGCQWLSSGPLPCQHSSPLLWFQRTSETWNLHSSDGHLKPQYVRFFFIKLSKNH